VKRRKFFKNLLLILPALGVLAASPQLLKQSPKMVGSFKVPPGFPNDAFRLPWGDGCVIGVDKANGESQTVISIGPIKLFDNPEAIKEFEGRIKEVIEKGIV